MPRPSFLSIALPLLLAAGCGGGDSATPEGQLSADQFANRIEEISVLRPDKEEKPSRIAALEETQVPFEYLEGPSCRFYSEGRLLLISAAPGAVAHIDGRAARLRITGPVGPSGGFFEAPGITFSVGRHPPPESAGLPPEEGAPASAPSPPSASAGIAAGATIGGDPSKPIERVKGSWACRA